MCLEEMDEDDEDAAFCCASAYSLCTACAPVVQQCVICDRSADFFFQCYFS